MKKAQASFTIVIDSPQGGTQISAFTTTVKGHVVGSTDLSNTLVFVNGKKCSLQDTNFRANIPLSDGENRISAIAYENDPTTSN